VDGGGVRRGDVEAASPHEELADTLQAVLDYYSTFKVAGLGPSYDSPKAKGDEAKPISPDDELTEVAFAVVTWKLRRPTRSWPTPCRPYWTTTRRWATGGFKVTGLGPSYDSPKPISPDDKLTEVAFAVVTWKLRRPTRSWPTPCRPYWTTARRWATGGVSCRCWS
ncbi:hypothetical protein PR003_g33897, partial [Phytophthora rubi]